MGNSTLVVQDLTVMMAVDGKICSMKTTVLAVAYVTMTSVYAS